MGEPTTYTLSDQYFSPFPVHKGYRYGLSWAGTERWTFFIVSEDGNCYYAEGRFLSQEQAIKAAKWRIDQLGDPPEGSGEWHRQNARRLDEVEQRLAELGDLVLALDNEVKELEVWVGTP